MSHPRTTAVALGLVAAGLAVGVVVKKQRAAAMTATTLTRGDVLVGPRLVVHGDGVAAVWLEYPKTLVVAQLDGARVTSRDTRTLPDEDATILQLVPFTDAQGALSVALLETGVRRAGAEGPLSRIVVRGIDLGAPAFTVLTEAPDAEAGEAPAAIVGAGPYTTARVPAVLWRRTPSDPGDHRFGAVAVSVLLEDGRVRTSELLGEGRSATAVAFRSDGAAVIAGSDSGQPFVLGPEGELGIDVPTPAVIASLVVPTTTPNGWTAAGLDAANKVFVIGGNVRSRQLRGLLPNDEALLVQQPDLADTGATLAPPLLLAQGDGFALFWPAAQGKRHELRLRPLDTAGAATTASSAVIDCPAHARLLSFDAVTTKAGAIVTAVLCVQHGRADVRLAIHE